MNIGTLVIVPHTKFYEVIGAVINIKKETFDWWSFKENKMRNNAIYRYYHYYNEDNGIFNI